VQSCLSVKALLKTLKKQQIANKNGGIRKAKIE
jgi:hypothetical protein